MSNKEPLTKLAEAVKAQRIKKNLSIRELARIAGIDNSNIVRLEKGIRTTPKPYILAKLAVALDLPLSDLFHLAGYENPNELPSLPNYLRAKSDLPLEAQEELVIYYRQLKKKHGTKGKSPGSKAES